MFIDYLGEKVLRWSLLLEFLTSIVCNYELLHLFDSVEVTAPDGIQFILLALPFPNSGDLHTLISSIFGKM